jgi:thymidylate synthase
VAEFDAFEQAYRWHLRSVLHHPTFRNSPRGFASRERLAVAFTIRNPLRRLVLHPSRRTNIVFNVAEALWYASGRDDLEYLAYYAPGMRRYSADGIRLTGTAYGPRIFRHGVASVDQWSSVMRVLEEDPDSKRAVVQIFSPEELLIPGNIDVACTIALQFLVRQGHLHTVTYMRANDAYRGMVSDVFSFTFLQEMLARQLGLDVGCYTHMVGSLHVYEPDAAAAAAVVRAPQPDRPGDDTMPAMPPGDNRSHIGQVMRIEEPLRRNSMRLRAGALERLDLPEYWRWVLALFELHRQARHGVDDPCPLLDRLPPVYRYLVLNRFPALAGESAGRT